MESWDEPLYLLLCNDKAVYFHKAPTRWLLRSLISALLFFMHLPGICIDTKQEDVIAAVIRIRLNMFVIISAKIKFPWNLQVKRPTTHASFMLLISNVFQWNQNIHQERSMTSLHSFQNSVNKPPKIPEIIFKVIEPKSQYPTNEPLINEHQMCNLYLLCSQLNQSQNNLHHCLCICLDSSF